MHCRGKSKEEKCVPFKVVCTNCGSGNVTVIAFDHWDLDIKCNCCDSYLNCGRYNPMTYEG